VIAAVAARLALAAVLLAAAPTQARAEVELANGWMRPAYAGQPSAAVYVDIRAEQPVRLVGANVALAKRVELVLVEPPSNDPATHRVVAELPVAVGRETRLALGGSHLRLLDVVRDVPPGERWPLELLFVDASGRRFSATTEVLVRGLMARRPVDAAPGN
jgi:copper(I)-binding protein